MRRSNLTIAITVGALLMALPISESARHSSAFAQAVTGASGAAPAPRFVGAAQSSNVVRPLSSLAVPPAGPAPGAPAALSTTSALPQLAPAPVVVQSKFPPQQTTFRCACFGNGTGTRWVGMVSAASFTQADGAAQGQCVNYLLNADARSPYIPLGGSGFTTRSPYPAVNPNLAPGNVTSRTGLTAQTEISAASSGELTVATYCQRCACN